MAKDAALPGPVSKPEGGFYETSEEIRERDAERIAAEEAEREAEEEKKDD